MNAKQKVIDAIEHFEHQQDSLEKLKLTIQEQTRIVVESRTRLVRTLKAVYGERSSGGVVFRGRRYAVREDGDTTEPLVIINADFEVLG